MRKLFGYDGVMVRLSEYFNTFLLSNILTILCCLPIITAPGALAAHQKVMQNFMFGEQKPIIKSYFLALWDNWGMAGGLLVLLLMTVAMLAVDICLVYFFTAGIVALLLYIILVSTFFVVIGIAACCLSLIVRYENTLMEHLRNALYMLLSHFSRIILMAVLASVPFAMFFLFPANFIQLLPLWACFGLSILVFLHTKLVKPILEELDSMQNDTEQEDDVLAKT